MNSTDITANSRTNAFNTVIAKSNDFHGAAIVDAHGREILITEHMIQSALTNAAENTTYNSMFRTLGQLLKNLFKRLTNSQLIAGQHDSISQ